MFDQKRMSQADFKLQGAKPTPIEADLKKVIEAFARLQQHRLIADYDLGRDWSRGEVNEHLATADEAFKAWRTIRNRENRAGSSPDHVRRPAAIAPAARRPYPPQISSAGATIAPPATISAIAFCASAACRHSTASETTITGRPVSSNPRTA